MTNCKLLSTDDENIHFENILRVTNNVNYQHVIFKTYTVLLQT